MPCQNCRQNILIGTQSWGLHRPENYSNPDVDVKKCTFCSQLRRDVDHQKKLEEYPTYRWTIRSSPIIRETRSAQYTTITFRPVEAQAATKSPAVSPSLPTRTFYIFDPSTLFIPRSLPKSTDISAVDGAAPQIKKWVSNCLTTHERCSGSVTGAPNQAPPGSPFVPTRVIDITRDPVYVLKTTSHPEFPTGSQNLLPAYATLSHCWGKHPMLMLTSSTLAEFTDPSVGIAWAKLPRTFQQAIQVARETLGVKYIWIDSLCIIQKDWVTGDEGDFATEGQLMHKVYRYSFCNIAAVDSADSTGGLFRGDGEEVRYANGNGLGETPDVNGADGKKTSKAKRKRAEILPELVPVRGVAKPGPGLSTRTADGNQQLGEKKFAILGDVWTSELLSGSLYARGWVFQERMLAPRILHFSSTQLFYDCATTSACEILPEGLPAPLDNVSSTERNWREMLLATRPQEPSTSSAPSRPPLERHLTGTADPSLETLWRESVRQYTSCDLTNYGCDRLAAIWGVAKIVRDRLRVDDPGEEYASGLWRRRLDQQLAWRVVDYNRAERLPELSTKHPSWSWASLKGEIMVASRWIVSTADGGYRVSGWVDGSNEGTQEEQPKRVEVDYEVEYLTDESGNRNDDLEPVLKRKKLCMRGVAFAAKWVVTGDVNKVGGKGGGQWTVDVEGTNKVLGGMTKLDVYPDVRPSADGECFLMILGLGKSVSARSVDEALEDGTGLILELVSGDSAVAGYKEYRRLGTFRAWGVTRDEFDKSLERGVENLYLV
ncbi:heterokaryon incompatibility protein-domain-containing protein [Rhypophila decipiens]|uniref:Heterokaryon incompatibility protein-domain-containing protein n=1 Tax=Rhypophila decipiens TaxID=261697 RepID=A0AAN7B2C3_9PEZI|nr:heterokaryon incompatibility protein-domain-containing protein [Rhypophila decipiens]